MSHPFASDIEKIAQSLIDAFSLTFEETDPKLTDPLIRWLDYRLRYIDPRPRTIARSTGFDSRVPAEASPALTDFVRTAEAGGNLNPYLTKSVRSNDSSGTKRQLRTDALWADWGIHHAHLTTTPIAPGDEFSDRSSWLLFFIALPNELGLIDVRSHNEPGIFQAFDLIETAIRTWPGYFERYAMKGIVSLARPPATDATSIRQLRTGGVNTMVEVDGKVYIPPGLGMTTAATPLRTTLERDQVMQMVRKAEEVLSLSGALVNAARENGKPPPVLSLRVSDQGRLVAYSDTDQQTENLLAERPGNPRSELEHKFLPKWAADRLVAYLAETGTPAVKSTH